MTSVLQAQWSRREEIIDIGMDFIWLPEHLKAKTKLVKTTESSRVDSAELYG